MSYKKLAEGLTHQIEHAQDKHSVNVTNMFQMLFEGPDRHIVSARILEGKSILIVAGLRSEILSPFPKYIEDLPGQYTPCDILGLVPVISMIAGTSANYLTTSMIEQKTNTRIILGFEGEDLRMLARDIWRFMARWDSWKGILLNILEKDALFELDWREFLAGESGFVTMDWYSPLSYQTRENALIKVVQAGKALLQSVLTREQLQKPVITGLVDWLNGLYVQTTIVGAEPVRMEGEA
ncbi:MAG: hypothetical protein ACTSU3_06495 [Candidatus Thorarchaeota archaeon]